MKKLNFLIISILLILPIISFSQYDNSGRVSTDKDGRIYYSNSVQEKLSTAVGNQFYDKSGKDLSITWENGDVDISKNNGNDSWDTRIDVGTDGTVGVVYNDLIVAQNRQKIFFRKKEAGSDTWSDSMYVDKGGEIGGRNCHMPAIAISPNGDMHVIYNVWAYENTRNYIGYSYYDAANDNWHDGIKLSEAGGSVNHYYGHHEVYSTDDNLPIVFWGFDNRVVSTVEEVYMKYYDGTDWSDDILVSSPDDYESAYFPHVTSMGNQKAMIIFQEIKSGTLQLMYRVYDEITHELSEILTVPGAICNPTYDNTDIANKNDGTLLIGTISIFNTSPWSDTLKMISYDVENGEFTMSEHQYTDVLAGPLTKTISISCNTAGECAIIYSDVSDDINGYMEFDYETGFSESEIITSQEMSQQDMPDSKFDFMGNLHVVWDDLRNNPPGGYDKRDVFYKMGTAAETYTLIFNITEIDGTTPIADADVTFATLTKTTDVNGHTEFENVIAGEYPLLVYKDGYGTYTDTITIYQNETFDISLDIISSINSLVSSGINIFPNPNSGTFRLQLNLSTEQNITVQILNNTGNEVYREEVGSLNNTQWEKELDISGLSQGVYFIHILTKETDILKKLILRK